jgi:peptidoglycan/LPS O-acetylase OafA/YrhL
MNAPRLVGFDALRIFALALVTWQHVATSLGAYAETQWRGISPGQSGVAIFCVIAGYLACRSRPESLIDWCRRRFFVVFPAYWLVTLAAFAMVLLVPNQEVTVGLFVSQMLGLGYFTHGWDLVNVVSWFVSLILLCYALTVLAWKTRAPRAFWWAIVAACTLLLAVRLEVPLSRHLLAYALGALIALAVSAQGYRVWQWGVLLAALTWSAFALIPNFSIAV